MTLLVPNWFKVERRLQMVMDMARAVAWGLSRLLRVPRNEPVAHRDLPHAHWDPASRRWFTHADDRAGTVDRAA